MNRDRQKKTKFKSTSLIVGFATILVLVLLTSYIMNQGGHHFEPPEFGVILNDPKYYSESEIADWHTINTGKFRIQTPKEFKFFRLQGIDSYVAGLTNQQDTFYFDYGLYSSSLKDLTQPDFQVTYKSINDKSFRIIIGQGVDYIAAFTDELPNDNRLMIECPDCSDLEEKRKMIETIKFEKK